jgi:hypothetical protein
LITNILDNVRIAWYRNVVTYDLARQVQTANSFGRFFTGSGRAITSAFKSFRTVASRLVRDWRVVVVCVQLWPSHSCSCAVGQRAGVAGSQQRWRTVEEKKAVLRLLRDVRRARTTAGPQL